MHFARSAARHRRDAGAATRRATEAEQRVAARDEEAAYLASTRLPGLLYALQQGTGGPAVYGALLHPELAHTDTGKAVQGVLEQVITALSEAAARSEGASRVAVQAATRSVQPLGYELQAAITKLLDSVYDDKTLGLVQPIDHAASQMIRRLQIHGVLTGMWPGRLRHDVPMLDAVRGGISRIRDYRRVQVPASVPLHVAGRYVEPLVLLLAELLDNAGRHSAPTTPVEVSVLQAHNSVSIEIHDAGPGMTPEALREAQRRVSGRDPVQFTGLSNPATFGLLGVGVLAAKYGFRVSLDLDHSRHGGVRAVVQVPRTMLAAEPLPQPEPAQRPAAPHPAPGATSAPPGQQRYEVAADGLPVRHRTAAPPPQPYPAAEQAVAPPPPRAGRALAAFVQGTRPVPVSSPQEELNP
ncbi:ATP-binding protein [Streptomyces griseiscabiei]|uniref:histidine kinase n=1 Tax=Streptomyces griseiscabiei TaxID=2993540 RepID=A0ABU4LE78_9ACTN|nr:sensor histidine kinase [Streptomyces griseiscabiei]MBZ3908435.1 sensor histidine kinase [Streptomyces griseiscabiei]MDX2913953.1 sensor histidine kinase [Streptomyces griseiscabiei]